VAGLIRLDALSALPASAAKTDEPTGTRMRILAYTPRSLPVAFSVPDALAGAVGLNVALEIVQAIVTGASAPACRCLTGYDHATTLDTLQRRFPSTARAA
jgi:hypothetical protein